MLLHFCTWQEVEAYLKQSQGIIIPIGSTEQHGPTGLIGTDAMTAEAVAHFVGKAAGALVAPTINVGMALHHCDFPGTISLRPSTLIMLVRDYIVSLARAGFRRFYFINGHGGNIATLQAAYSELYNHFEELAADFAAKLRCQTANWFQCRAVEALAKELYGDEEGSHATPSEIAMTQHLYPEHIKQHACEAKTAPSGIPIYSATQFRRSYPDGRMGSNPALAQAEHGRQFLEAAGKELTQDYLDFLKQL